MTKEQGLELIELLFIRDSEYFYRRASSLFFTQSGEIVELSYIDDKQYQQELIALLDSRYGKSVLKTLVAAHIKFQTYCKRNHGLWEIVCNKMYDPIIAVDKFGAEFSKNFSYLSQIYAFDDEIDVITKKSHTEKEQFTAELIKVFHLSIGLLEMNRKLYTQALGSLIGKNDFSDKPWEADSEKRIEELLTKMKEQLDKSFDSQNQKLSDQLHDMIEIIDERISNPVAEMYRVGLRCGAFVQDPEKKGKYLIKGQAQTKFRQWIRSLLKEGVEWEDIPTPFQISGIFRVENKRYDSATAADKSIGNAFEIAKNTLKPL